MIKTESTSARPITSIPQASVQNFPKRKANDSQSKTIHTHFKGQRVGVFVDVQNLYYSAKHLYNAKTNFATILKAAVGNRILIRAIAYVIKADVKEE